MENDRILSILYQISLSVLERLAFIFSVPSRNREQIYDKASAASYMKFSGPLSGALMFVITERALAEVTENMLGVEDPELMGSEHQQDALKEIVNVICGNLLPEIVGRQLVFNFSMPEIISTIQIAQLTGGVDGRFVAKLDLERGKCDVVLILHDHAE